MAAGRTGWDAGGTSQVTAVRQERSSTRSPGQSRASTGAGASTGTRASTGGRARARASAWQTTLTLLIAVAVGGPLGIACGRLAWGALAGSRRGLAEGVWRLA